MLRFPNPSSTINNFVAVYRALFKKLHGQVVDLDDFVETTVSANLATSSGYLGQEAIVRSTREDRSLDPLYNQLKMYAELFRLLGWIHSTEEHALKFSFTLLGHQIVIAGDHYLPLFGESVLGISYPNHVLKSKGTQTIRPFGLLLRSMAACDECLSRDEMIVGPLSVESDQNFDTIQNIANEVFRIRRNLAFITEALESVASRNNVQVNTLRNYTRWPIAVMRDLGWTKKTKLQYRESGQFFEAHKLTRAGRQIAKILNSSNDIRMDQIDKLQWSQKAAISTYAHFSMLERAGFEIGYVSSMLDANEPVLKSALEKLKANPTKPLIYSPFQSLSIADINRIFSRQSLPEKSRPRTTKLGIIIGRGTRTHLFVKPNLVHYKFREIESEKQQPLVEQIRLICNTYRSTEQAASKFASRYKNSDKNQFYPVVCDLFEILGFQTDLSRFGVNYARWDASLVSNGLIIPIEIKSPSEEEYLSTKAVRQAVENKIVILARERQKSSFNSTSLIVGYRIPNERGNLSMLIDDVFQTFGINIGVVDYFTLTRLSFKCITEELSIQPSQLTCLRGFLCG